MNGFDSLARIYEPLERLSFAGRLQEIRRFCLPYLSNCKRGLLIGDGDGRFSSELLQHNAGIEIDSVDISPRMLEVARKRAGIRSDRLRSHACDALDHPYPTNAYDFVGLHFCLDCFSQDAIDRLLPQLEASLRPGGLLAYSDFQANKPWQARVVQLLYLCFRLSAGLTIRRLPTVRWSDDFEPIARKECLRGLVFSQVLRKG